MFKRKYVLTLKMCSSYFNTRVRLLRRHIWSNVHAGHSLVLFKHAFLIYCLLVFSFRAVLIKVASSDVGYNTF